MSSTARAASSDRPHAGVGQQQADGSVTPGYEVLSSGPGQERLHLGLGQHLGARLWDLRRADVRHRGHVELVLTDAPSEELPQPRVVAVLGRGGDLALQPDEEPAHVVGADRGHVIGQALLMEVLGERDDCAGVVVQRLR
jgi:hypothetical protein